ncbi:cytochrome c biogenesis protein ResB [Pseudoclavibacter sp. CFCC 13796]|uniref:cytochrome c biogenesis protein ResB n=1 Tax=Pseudoclavibacter sp. CFCC 13796 TaxID=2615179 RepID=UPI001CE4109E|nr:cytochrome c biogenesis protein ResB [Pseudoclavibacter sp. CFCC 13796]
MSRSSENSAEAEQAEAAKKASAADRARVEADARATTLSTGRQTEALPQDVKLGFVGWLRFLWRQLTSMRIALLLLLLLAIASVPGSIVPQRGADPNGVTKYFNEHPDLAPVLDKLSLFDVYASPWYSAIYLLLFISLIGCIVPRIKLHAKALFSKPPKTPVRLGRLAGYQRVELPSTADAVAATPEQVIATADRLLAGRHYRRARYDRPESKRWPAAVSVSAERGYLRETGNLLFHVALVGVLIAVGIGGGISYHGQRVIVQGGTFPNTLSSYDSFSPGRWFSSERLKPFAITLDSFETKYAETMTDIKSGAYGQPLDYTADVTVHHADGSEAPGQIKVNQPLNVDGTDVFLLGNGYAPKITVRDPQGQVVFSDPVPFLPQDSNLTSMGVVKVTDVAPQQIGMLGYFYPTEASAHEGMSMSVYPALDNPVLSLNVYVGDLGVDQGEPKSVYTLDPDGLEQIAGGPNSGDGGSVAKSLRLTPGQTVDLPGGRGTVTFDEVRPYVSLEMRHDASQVWVLGFALLAAAGLIASLFVPRRRIWVRAWSEPVPAAGPNPAGEGETASADGTRTVFEIGGLARGDDHLLEDAVRSIAARLARAHDDTNDNRPQAGDAVKKG